jgi:hypothetical protein
MSPDRPAPIQMVSVHKFVLGAVASSPELLRRLIEDTSIKSWLFHPAQRLIEAEWVKARRKRPRPPRTVISRIDAAAPKLRS